MTEPELASGDSGEWVEQLQTRLHALGAYTGALDGQFGVHTAEAVRSLQSEHGLTADGNVGPQTWAAIGAAESAAGLHPHAFAEAHGQPTVGALSEDQQWRWDGEHWQAEPQPAVAAAAPAHEEPAGAAGGHKSADGQWLWDGTKWEPVT